MSIRHMFDILLIRPENASSNFELASHSSTECNFATKTTIFADSDSTAANTNIFMMIGEEA